MGVLEQELIQGVNSMVPVLTKLPRRAQQICLLRQGNEAGFASGVKGKEGIAPGEAEEIKHTLCGPSDTQGAPIGVEQAKSVDDEAQASAIGVGDGCEIQDHGCDTVGEKLAYLTVGNGEVEAMGHPTGEGENSDRG
jgi:hypothetical protein